VNKPTLKKADRHKTYSTVSLHLTLDAKQISSFFQLLQQGFRVKAQVGRSIKNMICEQFGVSPEYIEERIKTIFLDGKPVDDVNTATVKDGSTLALSAAMPGLAGATLRRGGFFASLRSQITHREDRMAISPGEGLVVLKLFNLLLNELGPIILDKGIYIRREDFLGFFESLPAKLWTGCKEAKVNSQKVDLDTLLRLEWLNQNDFVFLQIYSEG
jgi:hypothetical protein